MIKEKVNISKCWSRSYFIKYFN